MKTRSLVKRSSPCRRVRNAIHRLFENGLMMAGVAFAYHAENELANSNMMKAMMASLLGSIEGVETEIRAVAAYTCTCSDRLPALILPKETRH